MKRFRLPKGAKKRIERWLALHDEDKPNECPFMTGDIHCADVCKKTFPRVRPWGSVCPCHAYTLNYVIKRAKEIIR